MKLSKTFLKQLIKECLVEILVEGIDSSSANTLREAATPKQRQQAMPQAPAASVRPRTALLNAVKESAGGNAVLESVLADTIVTTMPTQLSSEGPMADPRTRAVSDVIFGEEQRSSHQPTDGNSYMADLAFKTSRPSAEKLLEMGLI